MENLGDKIVQKIKEEKILPKPRWHFLLEDYFIWFVFLFSLLLGALAFCVILHIFFVNDWDLYPYLHTTLVGHVFASIPYIWFGVLFIFIWIAYYNFKHTKNGYRFETFYVVALSVAGSLLLGAFLHTLGIGRKIEDVAEASLPFYERIVCCGARRDIWSQPAIGLLGGQIISVTGEKSFNLKDFGGSIWTIQESDDTLEYEPLVIKVGEQVKIIGEEKEAHVFWAREIRPWNDKGEARRVKERVMELNSEN